MDFASESAQRMGNLNPGVDWSATAVREELYLFGLLQGLKELHQEPYIYPRAVQPKEPWVQGIQVCESLRDIRRATE